MGEHRIENNQALPAGTTETKNHMPIGRRAVDDGPASSPSQKRPAEAAAPQYSVAEEEYKSDVASPTKKRARSASAPTVVAPQLPSDVLAQIFSQLGVKSLGRVAQVCRSWRSTVDDYEVWKCLCERVGLLNTEKLAPARHMLEREAKLHAKVQACPPGSARREKWQRKVAAAYRMYYKKYRERVCAHCGKAGVRSVAYELFDRLPICKPCRALEPFAYIALTNARKYFKYGSVAVEAPGQQLRSVSVQFTYRWGTIYRFTDMVKLSEIAEGPERAAVNAMAARIGLGIRKMEGANLKDV